MASRKGQRTVGSRGNGANNNRGATENMTSALERKLDSIMHEVSDLTSYMERIACSMAGKVFPDASGDSTSSVSPDSNFETNFRSLMSEVRNLTSQMGDISESLEAYKKTTYKLKTSIREFQSRFSVLEALVLKFENKQFLQNIEGRCNSFELTVDTIQHREIPAIEKKFYDSLNEVKTQCLSGLEARINLVMSDQNTNHDRRLDEIESRFNVFETIAESHLKGLAAVEVLLKELEASRIGIIAELDARVETLESSAGKPQRQDVPIIEIVCESWYTSIKERDRKGTSNEKIAIGIDIGTTNCYVAVFRNDAIQIIQDQDNEIPGMVTFTENGQLVGRESKERYGYYENTVYGLKRIIGREFTDPAIANDISTWPFDVYDNNGKLAIKVRQNQTEKSFYPEEILAIILEKLKSIAEDNLGQAVKDAVITVPAYFDSKQRKATMDAARIAGLNILQLINEPTAAVIAYGLHKKCRSQRMVLVYHLGDQTFDISVVFIEDAAFQIMPIIQNSHLGGKDFNKKLVDYFAEQVEKQLCKKIYGNRRAYKRLEYVCKQVKLLLSTHFLAEKEADCIIDDDDFTFSITRTQFEELIHDLLNETMEKMKKALEDREIDKNSIDDIVLVGGSTSIPKVQEMLKELFQKQELHKDIDPTEVVARGAAIVAAQLARCSSSR